MATKTKDVRPPTETLEKANEATATDKERDERIIQTIRAYKTEADTARVTRMNKNRENFDAFNGHQDWSYKQEGQSTEFLPKVSGAVESFVAFAKRGMIQFGDWFSVDVPPNYPLSAASVQRLMKYHLDHIYDGPNKTTNFAIRVSDALKSACMESLFCLKINVRLDNRGEERGISPRLQLQIDLVRNEDYRMDPTGRGLYVVHSVERDLYELKDMAVAGAYDVAVVQQIHTDSSNTEQEIDKARRTDQDTPTKASVRKRVQIDELWGTALHDGKVIGKNILSAVANDQYLIRPPEPNPFWHGEDPFVAAPLIRVPHSTWHKALMDDAVALNLAQNEMFNLILDGGMASVWGTRQVRSNYLKNPGDISDGIPVAATLEVTDDLPPGVSVVETVSTGSIPPDALAVFNLLSAEFAGSSFQSELQKGAYPAKQVKATEVVEASQSSAVLLDSIISDLEREALSRALTKSWALIVQYLDSVSLEALSATCTPQEIIALARMSEDERRRMITATFKVHGLSATLNRVRDFQKLMALLEATGKNPMLIQAFIKKYSGTKLLDKMFRLLNIDPRDIEISEEEAAAAAAQPPAPGGEPGAEGMPPGPTPAAQAAAPTPIFEGGPQPGSPPG